MWLTLRVLHMSQIVTTVSLLYLIISINSPIYVHRYTSSKLGDLHIVVQPVVSLLTRPIFPFRYSLLKATSAANGIIYLMCAQLVFTC